MKKKILASILAVTTLATCAFSAVACNKEVPKDEVSSSVVEEVKEEGEVVVNDVTATPGMRLNVVKALAYNANGSMAVAEDAYTLTATVLPEDAADKTVTYTATWENANSTWAKNKSVTDYVNVTQTSAGSLTATATCMQAFGEPFIVTVISNDNPDAKATATLHYKQKVEYFMLSDDGSTEPSMEEAYDYTEYSDGYGFDNLSVAITVDFSDETDRYDGEYITYYIGQTSVYTREAYTDTYVSMSPTDSFQQVLNNLGCEQEIQVEQDGIPWRDLPCSAWDFYVGATNQKKNEIITALINFEGVAYTVTLKDMVSGKSATFNISLDTSLLSNQKRVESVNLDNVEFEF